MVNHMHVVYFRYERGLFEKVDELACFRVNNDLLPLKRLWASSLIKTYLVYADSPVEEVIKHLHEVRTFGAPRRK
jgi:hypothetical protein